jgi:hypothetical protein
LKAVKMRVVLAEVDFVAQDGVFRGGRQVGHGCGGFWFGLAGGGAGRPWRWRSVDFVTGKERASPIFSRGC